MILHFPLAAFNFKPESKFWALAETWQRGSDPLRRGQIFFTFLSKGGCNHHEVSIDHPDAFGVRGGSEPLD